VEWRAKKQSQIFNNSGKKRDCFVSQPAKPPHFLAMT